MYDYVFALGSGGYTQMSVDLTMLGKSIERLQQEVREVHAEQTSLWAELAGLRAHFTAHLTGLHASLEAVIEARLGALGAALDGRLGALAGRFDALDAALDARFETTHRQMATTLEVVLTELRASRREGP